VPEEPAVAQPVESAEEAGRQDGAPGPRERIVRPLDFSQPNKFSTELRRRLSNMLRGFCGELARRLEDELKSEVGLELEQADQQTWAAAKAKLPADALAVGIHIEGSEQQMLLSVELPWLLQALECLLGSKAAQAPAERRLTEVDWALTEQLLDVLLGQLSIAWSDLGGGALSRGDFDLEGDAGMAVSASEATLSLAVRSEIGGCPSSMSLLVPWPCVESLAGGGRAGSAAPRRENGAAELSRAVAEARVLLRAEIGSVQMPIERMRAIAPGALLELEQLAEDGVRLFAEEVSLGRGRPGASGTHRALKIDVADDPPVHAEPYARLGRSDLQRARTDIDEAVDGVAEDPILHSIFVRVWAELGRTHLSLGGALELAPGSVVELDQTTEAPVELFANGLCFANGSLVVTPQGTWAVQVEKLT
jgi:flagellar motor switch protein FliM